MARKVWLSAVSTMMLCGSGFVKITASAAPPDKSLVAAGKPAIAASPAASSKPVSPAKAVSTATPFKSQVTALIAEGDALYVAGNVDDAAKQFQSVLSAAEGSKDKKGMVAALDRLATCRASQKDLIEEEKLRQKAVAAAQDAYGEGSAQVAMQMAQLAGVLARKGAVGDARETLDKAKGMLEKAAGEHALEDAVVAFNEGSMQAAQRLGGLAEESLKHACTLLSDRSGAKLYYARALEEQAAVLDQLERQQDANAVREKLALLRSTSITGSGTSASTVSTKTGADPYWDHVKAAITASLQNDRDTAIDQWKLALKEAETSKNHSDGRVAYVLLHLGDEYQAKKMTGEAEAMYKRSLELREKSNATNTLGMARNLGRLAVIAGMKQDFRQADALLTRALRIEDDCKADDSIVAATLQAMASPCTMLKLTDKSEANFKRLLEIADRGRVTNALMLKSMSTTMLGGLYMSTGRLQQGMNLIKQMQSMTPQSPEQIQKVQLQEFVRVETLIDEAEQKTIGGAGNIAGGTTASH